jgi:flagellar motor switch protein FliN/FliY
MSPMTTTREALGTAQTALLSALSRVAPALARSLPADTAITAGEVDDGAQGRNRLLPGADARAVQGTLSGPVSGSVVLIASAALAEAVEHGPVLQQLLVDGLAPALSDAVAVLGTAVGEDLQLAAVQEVSAQVALGQDGDGAAYLGLSILDGGQHVATFAVVITSVNTADEVDTEPAHVFEPLVSREPETPTARPLDLLADVEMQVTAELGRTRMTVRDLLALTPGSVVELDRLAGSPVDVLVNGTLVARGEVVVIDEEFGVRISEIIGLETPRPRSRAATT